MAASFPFHPRLSVFLCVAEAVQLLRQAEVALYRFLPQFVVVSYPQRVAVFFRFLQIIRPHMPRHCFNVILAVGALRQIGAMLTYLAAAPVFPVSVTVRSGIA